MPLSAFSVAKPSLPANIASRFLVAYSTKSQPPDNSEKSATEAAKDTAKDAAKEAKAAGEKLLEAKPGQVTVESSRRHLFEPYEKTSQNDPNIAGSLKGDVHSIQEALALTTVPRETYALGLGGTIPYLLTSLSTVYLGWNLRHSYPTSSTLLNSFMVSHETAQQWLQLLEPIQLGYGAVILSFLGALHWGMEFNEKTHSPERAKFRYTLGVLAPAMAWPTLFLPVHFALTGQFLAFTIMYFADSRATTLGWAPQWYATYRFVLTFVVGSAILVSLVFRAKIDDVGENMTARLDKGMHQRGRGEENYSDKWARLEQEDKEKAKKEEEEKKKQKAKEAKEKKKSGKGDKGEKGATGENTSDDGKIEDGEKDEKEEKPRGDKGDESKDDEKNGDDNMGQAKGDDDEKDGGDDQVDDEKSGEKDGDNSKDDGKDEKSDGDKNKGKGDTEKPTKSDKKKSK
ncbi:hypothetical protein SEUCBS140593_007549 [Sporothrix eucalyptigena]|uniref:Mitochondrial inner membrane protein 1 n=1 Tax=Sporothrix eucalyptigena TaxID=1812306 RepID=A0ABP0CE27_9PEZI